MTLRFADGEIGTAGELLTVGEVSRRTGVAVSALHYYERLGLIASTRTAGNQRRFPRHMLRRIGLITIGRRLGISLSEIQESFAELPNDSAPTQEHWERASTRWKRTLEARRTAIEQLEQELTGCIGCGCLSMEACSLMNPGDALQRDGSGPRRITLPEAEHFAETSP